jgi:dTDP-4-dehydrorhamnose reductase
MKPEVLGTGLSGLVGTRIVELLGEHYTFSNLDLSEGVDILDKQSIFEKIKNSSSEVVLHLAAFTDVNAAQEQNGDKTGSCWQVNVVGTQNIVEVCKELNKHLIHLSTGYVFDGQKSEAYTEEDTTNPTDWYSVTKTEAEKVVHNLLPEATILRINFPYRTDEFPKRDIWHKMADALQAGKTGPFFADHFFTLTPIEWLTEVMHWAIETKPAGIFHTTSDTVYSDYSLAQEIAKSIGVDPEAIQKGSLQEFNKTATRPYQPSLILSNRKLQTAMRGWKA